MILMAAARERLGARVHTGKHLRAFRETPDGTVIAEFVDRESGIPVGEETGDILDDRFHETCIMEPMG